MSGPSPSEPERVGPFASWSALYATILIYTAALIAVLAVLSTVLDYSG